MWDGQGRILKCQAWQEWRGVAACLPRRGTSGGRVGGRGFAVSGCGRGSIKIVVRMLAFELVMAVSLYILRTAECRIQMLTRIFWTPSASSP